MLVRQRIAIWVVDVVRVKSGQKLTNPVIPTGTKPDRSAQKPDWLAVPLTLIANVAVRRAGNTEANTTRNTMQAEKTTLVIKNGREPII